MWIRRVILLAIAVGLIVFLYSLPKVVVENEENQIAENTADESTDSNIGTKDLSFSSTTFTQSEQTRIENLRQKFFSSNNKEKSAIFADSLADLYTMKGDYDSAVWFAEKIVADNSSWQSFFEAANTYYHAFEHAGNQEESENYRKIAQDYFQRVVDAKPDMLEAKSKLAMTYVASASPMQGVMMLREVIEQDPDNELALLYLGILSVQSGQFELAAERFEKLLSLNQEHLIANFYLGMSYKELGQNDKAIKQLEKVIEAEEDPEVQSAARNLLEDIK